MRTQAGIFGERAGLFAFTGPFPVALTTSGTCAPWTPPPGASRLLDGAGVAFTPHVPQDTEQQSTDQGRRWGRGRERRGRRGQGWGRRSGRSWGTERAASPTPHVDARGRGRSGIALADLPDLLLCHAQSPLRGQDHGRHRPPGARGSPRPCRVRGRRAGAPRESLLIRTLRHLPGTELLLLIFYRRRTESKG